MSNPVLVQVLGFNDIERHALNSLLRISEHRTPSYKLWTPDMLDKPSILLVDGRHRHAQNTVETAQSKYTKVLWVGEQPHPLAWHSFSRPIAWIKILQGMDYAYKASLAHSPDPVVTGFGVSVVGEDDRPTEPVPVTFPAQQIDKPLVFRKRVLVVDDNLSARLYLKARLALNTELDVDEASSGEQALMMARIHHYHGILLDVNMPGTDGYEVCRTIKRMVRSPAVVQATGIKGPKIVMITSRSSVVDRLRGNLAGADAYLPKPPLPAKLKELISAL